MVDIRSGNLKQTSDRLSLLDDVAQLVSTVPHLENLLGEVTRVIHGAAESLDIVIGLLDPDSGDLSLQARAGRYEQYEPGFRVPRGQGIAGYTAEVIATVVCNDVRKEVRYLELLPSTRSQLTIPLRWNERVFGIFVAESTELDAFAPEDVRVFENLCHLISTVIENSRLNAALTRRNTTLTTLFEISTELSSLLDLDLLLDRLSQLLGRMVEHELFALLLVDERRGEFVWKSGVGYADLSLQKLKRLRLNQGIVGRVYQQREPVLVPDVAEDPDYVPAETVSGKVPASALAVPLIRQDRVLGVLLMESTLRDYFTLDHLQVVNTLAIQMAIAIENAQLYEARNRDALVKQLLNEVGKEISTILDLDVLLPRIATLTRQLIDYRVFAIGLLNPEREVVELKLALGVSPETAERFRNVALGQGVMSRAIREGQPVVIDDLREHPTRIPIVTDAGEEPRSMIAVPLVYQHAVRGVLAMQSTSVGFFSSEDVQTVSTLASQIAAAIENAKLFEELSRREQRLENDFQIAKSMQRSMLPKSLPATAGFEFAARYVPAGDLAGDFYDYLRLDQERIGFCIGDVSGKGVSAALVMAASRSAVRSAARGNYDPSQVLYTANRQIYRDIRKQLYVALFYGILHFGRGWFTWSNAGHHPPFRITRDDQISRLETGGTVLGLFDNARYQKQRTPLEPGDLYVFYTDGVVDAEDREEQEFGTDRLLETVIASRDLTARKIRDKVLRRVQRHSRGVNAVDDITLVILKCP